MIGLMLVERFEDLAKLWESAYAAVEVRRHPPEEERKFGVIVEQGGFPMIETLSD